MKDVEHNLDKSKIKINVVVLVRKIQREFVGLLFGHA